MKAFIEYPEAGEGRIEITSEFVVQTYKRFFEKAVDFHREQTLKLAEARRYWKDEC